MHEIPIATESQHRRRNDEMETNDDAQFYGRQEHPPSRVGKMVSLTVHPVSLLALTFMAQRAKDKRRATDSVQPTQLLEPTQAVSSADSSMVMDTSESSAQEQTAISAMSKGVDTQLLMNLMEQQSESFQISGGHEILGGTNSSLSRMRRTDALQIWKRNLSTACPSKNRLMQSVKTLRQKQIMSC